MYRSLVVLAAGMFAIGADSFVVAGILPDAADSLGLALSPAGWLPTACAFTCAVLGPVMERHTPSFSATRGALRPWRRLSRCGPISLRSVSWG